MFVASSAFDSARRGLPDALMLSHQNPEHGLQKHFSFFPFLPLRGPYFLEKVLDVMCLSLWHPHQERSAFHLIDVRQPGNNFGQRRHAAPVKRAPVHQPGPISSATGMRLQPFGDEDSVSL